MFHRKDVQPDNSSKLRSALVPDYSEVGLNEAEEEGQDSSDAQSEPVADDLVCHGVPGQADQYACWANTIDGISTKTLLGIKGVCGGKHEFAKCLYELPGSDLTDITRLVLRSEEAAKKITSRILHARQHSPEEELETLKKAGVSTVCYDDEWYPEKLRRIYNPPYLLYYYGKLPSSQRKSLAVIGSRMATAYGREQARLIARTMAANGVQIISGMARGVDGIASRAALDAGGVSVAILGGGPDICYPKENEVLYEDLKTQGCILSEYHPGIPPEGRFFAARNRLISALSDAVLVVEAKEKSGTMITVEFALDQGKDVLAVPGRVCDANSRGCNQLIQHGAGVVTCPDDLLEYFFGVEEDKARDSVAQLRQQRAEILEDTQRAAFWERDGRGPGYLHQMDWQEVEKGKEQDHFSSCPKEQNAFQAGTAAAAVAANGKDKGKRAALRNGKSAQAEKKGPQEEKRPLQEQGYAKLSELEKNLLSCLDRATPRNLEDLLPQVRSKMKRNVAYSELIGCMTRLAVKNYVTEVRVGYYLET